MIHNISTSEKESLLKTLASLLNINNIPITVFAQYFAEVPLAAITDLSLMEYDATCVTPIFG